MKPFLLRSVYLLILVSFCLNANAQGSSTNSWANKFGYQKSFIENKGQFSIPDAFGNPSPVLFAVDHASKSMF